MTQPREAFTLTFETPDGPLSATLAVPAAPMRLPELAFGFMNISDRFTDLAVTREVKTGRAISCKKGCGACCCQVVPLSPPEAFLIRDLVASMKPPMRSEIEAAFAEASRRLDTSGVKALFQARIETVDQMLAATLEYFRLGIPCPFLRDDACSIHRYRPSMCREYMVTSPAENCAELGRAKVDRVSVAVRLSEALTNLWAKLLGKEPEIVPLTLALEWAEKHREDGLRTWPARDLIQGLVAELQPRT